MFCHLGWQKPLVFSLGLLLNPYCSLTYANIFHIIKYLDDNLVLIHCNSVGKRTLSFLCSLLGCLGLHIKFSKSELNLVFEECFGIVLIFLYLWHLINSLSYSSWLIPFCRNSLLTLVRSCLALARLIFVPMDIPSCTDCVMTFRVPYWMFFFVLFNYFLLFTLLFQCIINWD